MKSKEMNRRRFSDAISTQHKIIDVLKMLFCVDLLRFAIIKNHQPLARRSQSKIVNYLSVVFVLCIVFTSCKKSPFLELSSKELLFTTEADYKFINVSCRSAFSVQSSSSWCIATSIYPSPVSNLKVSVDANRTVGEERTAMITVTCDGITDEITVKQLAKTPFLEVKADPISFYYESSIKAIPCSTNLSVKTVSSDPSWCTAEVVNNNSEIEIRATRNADENERTATITITAGKMQPVQIEVKQDPGALPIGGVPLAGIKGTYAAPPLNSDGSINMEKLLDELKGLNANTYHWLIAYNKFFGLDYVKKFLPMAARENINVWVTILPPTEQPRLGWSEPYRLDFEKWAEELATLSLMHKSLTAWSIDDFSATGNQYPFTPTYVSTLVGKMKAINPNFKFVPCVYYPHITNVYAEKHIPLLDGILYPYPASLGFSEEDPNLIEKLQDLSLMEKEIEEVRGKIKRDIPIIIDLYATAHRQSALTTPEYITAAIESGMKSAEGIMIYCHPNPVTDAAKYKAISEAFGKNVPDFWRMKKRQTFTGN